MKFLKCLTAMAVLVGTFHSANAAELQAPLAKRGVELTVVQQGVEQAAKGAEAAKQQVPVWKFKLVGLPKTQTDWYAQNELTTLTAYLTAASGINVTTSSGRDPVTREYLLEVALKQQQQLLAPGSSEILITPDIPGLQKIDFVSNCPRNSHYEAKFASGTKLTEEQMLRLKDLVRFMAAINHGVAMNAEATIAGIDPKTEAAVMKPVLKSDGTMAIVITFADKAFDQQIIGRPVPVVSAF